MDFFNDNDCEDPDEDAGLPSDEQLEQIKRDIADRLGIPSDQVHAHIVENPTPEMLMKMLGDDNEVVRAINNGKQAKDFISTVLGHGKALAMLARMNQMRGLNFFDAETDEEKQFELLTGYQELTSKSTHKGFMDAAEKMKAMTEEVSLEESVHHYAVACLELGAKELRETAAILDDIRSMYDPQEVEEETDES